MTDDLFDRWLEHHREEDTPSTKTWPVRREAEAAEEAEGDAPAADAAQAEPASRPIDPLTDDLSVLEAIPPAPQPSTPETATPPETAAAPPTPEPASEPIPAAPTEAAAPRPAAKPTPAPPIPAAPAATERTSFAGPPEDTTWQAELFDAVKGGEPTRP